MNISLRRTAATPTTEGHHGIRAGARGIQRFLGQAATHRAIRQVHDMLEDDTDRRWFWRSLQLEVERTRRQESEFTVLSVMNITGSRAVDLAATIAPHLRATDAVAAEQDRVLILLSDTAGNAAKAAVERLSEHAGDLAADTVWHDVVFPRDALTFHGLVECLRQPVSDRQMPLAG